SEWRHSAFDDEIVPEAVCINGKPMTRTVGPLGDVRIDLYYFKASERTVEWMRSNLGSAPLTQHDPKGFWGDRKNLQAPLPADMAIRFGDQRVRFDWWHPFLSSAPEQQYYSHDFGSGILVYDPETLDAYYMRTAPADGSNAWTKTTSWQL